MNSMEMVEQNVRTASEYGVGCMTESDACAGGSGAAGDHKARQGGMHRLRLLHAVPARRGYPRNIPLLQCDVLRRKKVRAGDYLQCTAFRRIRRVRRSVWAAANVSLAVTTYRDPQGVKSGGRRTETVKYKFMKTAIGVLKLW